MARSAIPGPLCELFVVEGLSPRPAGFRQKRWGADRPNTQAIIAAQGKILKVEKKKKLVYDKNAGHEKSAPSHHLRFGTGIGKGRFSTPGQNSVPTKSFS